MPRKSGKAARDEMRAMSEKVKFLFVSGHASDIIEREGDFGADVEVIEKPILPYELLEKIKLLIPPFFLVGRQQKFQDKQ
jgi:DNA-binding response OmpR family regulator